MKRHLLEALGSARNALLVGLVAGTAGARLALGALYSLADTAPPAGSSIEWAVSTAARAIGTDVDVPAEPPGATTDLTLCTAALGIGITLGAKLCAAYQHRDTPRVADAADELPPPPPVAVAAPTAGRWVAENQWVAAGETQPNPTPVPAGQLGWGSEAAGGEGRVLGPKDLAALEFIGRQPGATNAAVGEHTGTTEEMARRRCNALAADRWLERAVPHGWALTAAGRQLVEDAS